MPLPVTPLPAHSVVGQIGIDERVPKPSLADTPVDPQMLDQKTRRRHARSIVHPTGLPELAHASIDEGIPRPALSPRAQRIGVGAIRIGIEAFAPVLFGKLWVMVENMVGEFAPADFAEEFVDVGRAFDGGVRDPSKDLARCCFAPMQMRRQARRVFAIRSVAQFRVAMDRVSDKRVETRCSAGFARLPKTLPSRRPIRFLITQASPQRSALRYQLDAKPLIFRDAPVEPLQG